MGRDSKGSDLGKEKKLRSRSRPGAAEGTKPSLGQEVLSQDTNDAIAASYQGRQSSNSLALRVQGPSLRSRAHTRYQKAGSRRICPWTSMIVNI